MTEHAVEIDEDRIAAGFDAYDAQPEPAAPGALAVQEQEKRSEWLGFARFVAEYLANNAPNWNVPEEKRQEWAEALAETLDECLPSGPGNPDEWPAWARLIMVSGGIVAMNMDWANMRPKPLTIEGTAERVPDDEDETETEPNAAPPAQRGSFSTMG